MDHLCSSCVDENDNPWNEWTFLCAAEKGNLGFLKYMYENGCQPSEWACKRASLNGNIDCLKYIHQIGYLDHEDVFMYVTSIIHSSCEKEYTKQMCLDYIIDTTPLKVRKILINKIHYSQDQTLLNILLYTITRIKKAKIIKKAILFYIIRKN